MSFLVAVAVRPGQTTASVPDFTCNAKRNREDQVKADHPSNKPSEKQRLRRARDEAVNQLQKQIEINGELSSKLAEYQTMSFWAFCG